MMDIASNALAFLGNIPAPGTLHISAALAIVGLLISFASRHSVTIVRTITVIAIAAVMMRDADSRIALVLCGFAVSHALGGFARRDLQLKLRRIEHKIQAMSGVVDPFLDGLERRSREHDRASNAMVVENGSPASQIAQSIAAE